MAYALSMFEVTHSQSKPSAFQRFLPRAMVKCRVINRAHFHQKWNKYKANRATFSELIYKVYILWRSLHLDVLVLPTYPEAAWPNDSGKGW